MSRFDLLATPRGRLAAFTLLYVGEGLPQGFAAAAATLELKRLGADAAVIGTFAATIMAPWAWKWAFGPLVDNLHLPRFGRRKQWVVAAQLGMITTLFGALAVFPRALDADGSVPGLSLLTAAFLLHNTFAACQDVAIDALAVGALRDEERGRANGLMFAGAQLGMAAGGSGVIALKGLVGFPTAALLVPAALSALLAAVTFGVREAPGPVRAAGAGLSGVAAELADYAVTVFRVFFTTRAGALGLLLALLPAGAMSLSLTVSTVLTPTLGMTDDEIATLGFASSALFAVACVAGGAVSDRLGRRTALALFAGSMALPTAWMAWQFQAAGWTHPPAAVDGVWPRAEGLVVAWTAASLVYGACTGLMYGVRSALYMDLAEPRIAATQFTASMALLNVVTIYSYWWQGQALTPVADGGFGWSVAATMGTDAAFGLVFLAVLPFLPARRAAADG